MTYFKSFNKLLYDFSIKTDALPIQEIVVDLSTRVSLFINNNDLNILTQPYTIADGDTPEIIAHKLYGDVNLHWVVMHINSIADLSREWPLKPETLMQYTIDKYGLTHVSDYHHSEKMPEMIAMDKAFIQTNYGDQEFVDFVDYSNLEHETRLNDLKRFILVIKPEMIQQYVTAFNAKLIL